jgi:hypothetical protein
MDVSRKFGQTGDGRHISNKMSQEEALRHIDGFIMSKGRRIAEYKKITENTPYDSVRSSIENIILREKECLEESRSFRNMVELDRLGEIKLRKTKDLQTYSHLAGAEWLEGSAAAGIRNILVAAITEDEDMISKLKLLAEEYLGTVTEKAAKHLMDSIISAKKDIAGRLLKLEQGGW